MARSLIVIALALGLCAPVMAAVPVPSADVVIICDESRSMSYHDVQWLANMVKQLEGDYRAAGVGNQPGCPNQYALFGFGSLLYGGRAHQHGGWMGASDMSNNIKNTLVSWGHVEDGYQAIQKVLTTLSFRPGTYRNVIFVSDEDRDEVECITAAHICYLLGITDARLNSLLNAKFAVGLASALGVKWDGTAYIPTGGGNYAAVQGGYMVCGFGNTRVDYAQLSWCACGSAWDLNKDWWGCEDALANAFTDVQIQELRPIVQTYPAKTCSDWMLAMGCLQYNGGQNCWYWFEYRELGSLIWQQSTVWYPALEGQMFTDYIRGLKPSTWYQVRAVVQNSVMRHTGSEWSVFTKDADVIYCPLSKQPTGGTCKTACGCN
jgi:hypothetical protein